MDSMHTIKKLRQLKQKAQAPIGRGWKSTYEHRSDQ